MSQYHPESQAAKIPMKCAFENGSVKPGGRAGSNTMLARNAADTVAITTVTTANSESATAGGMRAEASLHDDSP